MAPKRPRRGAWDHIGVYIPYVKGQCMYLLSVFTNDADVGAKVMSIEGLWLLDPSSLGTVAYLTFSYRD